MPNTIHLVDLAIAGNGLDWPAGPCRPWLSRQATQSTLGQRTYLPSCCTRGFLTLAKFESKLAVRALMWTGNSGTPICLLRTMRHQEQCEGTWIVTPVVPGHLCGQRTSTRGTPNTSSGGWVAYIAGLCSWRRAHTSYSWGDTACPSFEQFSFWLVQCEATSWVVYLGSLPDNELCRSIGLVPWRVLLVGAWWSAVRHARNLSRCT